MARGDGFLNADIDVGILDDVKFRRLVRATKDAAVINACVTGYLAVVAASWGHGERLSLEEAAPAWFENTNDVAARLTAFDLLDSDGRVPEHAWESWYGAARDRREGARAGGRKGADRRYGRSGTDGEAMGTPSVPYTRPSDLPTGRTGIQSGPADTQEDSPARAREDGAADDGAPSDDWEAARIAAGGRP